MDEAHFWLNLEYSALESGGEIWASGRSDIQGWWCDGFELETYALDAEPPYIEGWIYTGKNTDKKWRFRLDLRNFPRVTSPEDIDWKAMYPVRGETGWLTIDTEREFVGMDFSVRDEPTEDIIVRKDLPPSFVPRDALTLEADIVSGDAERVHRTVVHTSLPEPRDSAPAWPEKPDAPTRMGKAYFWYRLQWRIGRELKASGRTDIGNLEMDGISLDAYELDGDPPRVEGTCWFKPRGRAGFGLGLNAGYPRAKFGPYRFLMKLEGQPRASAPSQLNFESLLPDLTHTGWLTVDTKGMSVIVDPSVKDEPTEQVLTSWKGPSKVIPLIPIDLSADRLWRHTRPKLRTRVLGKSLIEEDQWLTALPPNERRFWAWLEILVVNEISASGRTDITGYRFERLAIDRYLLDQSPPRIEGSVWFLEGDRVRREQRGNSGRYHFSLLTLGQHDAVTSADLNFEVLLPKEGYTGWLAIDLDNKRIEVDPAIRELPTEDLLTDDWGRYTAVAPGDEPPTSEEDLERRRPRRWMRTYRRHVRGRPRT